MIFIRSFLAGLLLALLALGRAEAGQFVQFKSGDADLVAYMARPTDDGSHAAVVLLHGCGGFHSSMLSWADRLSRLGYVALAVDSLGPRGLEVVCAGPPVGQSADAYAALHFLVQQSFVRADAVALMGFSMGGGSTLMALEPPLVGQVRLEKFRAGVAFYPLCFVSSGVMTAPTLILIGERDDWTPARECADMIAGKSALGNSREPADRSNVKLIVYPGAHHAFDLTDLVLVPGGVNFFGHQLEYNDAATKDSIAQVRAFLQDVLKP